MICAGRPFNRDKRFAVRKRSRYQRTAEPPAENQKRPFKQVFILGNPKPNPNEIGEAVAHRHPKKHPKKAVSLRYRARMADKMKNAVIHQHIKKSRKQADEKSHILLFEKQNCAKHNQESDIKPNIQRRKSAPCNEFCHRNHPNLSTRRCCNGNPFVLRMAAL